jgi:hypothetical protein
MGRAISTGDKFGIMFCRTCTAETCNPQSDVTCPDRNGESDKVREGLHKMQQGFEIDDKIRQRLKEMGYDRGKS